MNSPVRSPSETEAAARPQNPGLVKIGLKCDLVIILSTIICKITKYKNGKISILFLYFLFKMLYFFLLKM